MSELWLLVSMMPEGCRLEDDLLTLVKAATAKAEAAYEQAKCKVEADLELLRESQRKRFSITSKLKALAPGCQKGQLLGTVAPDTQARRGPHAGAGRTYARKDEGG